MKRWYFWQDMEDYFYILPLLAVYDDPDCFIIKIGWFCWRGGLYINK